MTDKEQTQLGHFVSHGYSPDLAVQLIACGAWLETASMSAQEVADVRAYRAERDGDKEEDHGVDAA